LTYSLSYAYGKSSSETSNTDNEIYEVKEFPLDWDERHTLNSNFTVLYGEGETLFELPYTDNWSLNLSTDFGSGKPFTPTTDYYDKKVAAEDIENNSERIPWTSNSDLKFTKSFSFTGENKSSFGELKLEFNVYNLFNKVNVFSVYSDTGSWWKRSDAFYDADATGARDYLVDIWKNTENIGERRSYMFGITYSW